jgi:hypothetical protein
MNLEKIGKVITSKFVGTGTSSYGKRIYRAAVSQRLRNTALKYNEYNFALFRNVHKAALSSLAVCLSAWT